MVGPVPIQPFTLEDRNAISAAIAHAEQKTSGEIVVVAAIASDGYRSFGLLWAALIALAVPTLSRSALPDGGVAEVAIKVLVLFYAAELVISHAGQRTWMLRVGVLGVLVLLVGRVLLVFRA